MVFLMIFIKTLAIIIGFSSALVNDVYTYIFLRDFNINKKEKSAFSLLAKVNLISAFILAVSFLVSFVYEMEVVGQDIVFATAIILLIVLINELLFRKMVIPALTKFRLDSDYIDVKKVVILRMAGLTLNAVSVVSWIYLLLIFQFGLSDDFFVTGYILGDYMFITSITILVINFICKSRRKFPEAEEVSKSNT